MVNQQQTDSTCSLAPIPIPFRKLFCVTGPNVFTKHRKKTFIIKNVRLFNFPSFTAALQLRVHKILNQNKPCVLQEKTCSGTSLNIASIVPFSPQQCLKQAKSTSAVRSADPGISRGSYNLWALKACKYTFTFNYINVPSASKQMKDKLCSGSLECYPPTLTNIIKLF